jgi:hypothetical protein
MKNLIVATIIGLLFMVGGFGVGMKLAPTPPPKSKATAQAQATAKSAPEAISIDTLRQTSETMMSLSQALQDREQKVAAREEKVKEKEDELAAERGALDRSHEKFKALFDEFQQRLILVEANQTEQLQKEADVYSAMGTDQSIELIRAMDDPAMIRLFSVMDTKPLGKLVAQWKTKYPDDVPRLLHALDSMAQVMPKEKIALTDPPTTADSSSPDSSAPATAPTADAPAPDPTATPPTDPNATASTPASAPAPDPSSDQTPASATPADSSSTPSLAPPPDASQPAPPPAPVSTTASN